MRPHCGQVAGLRLTVLGNPGDREVANGMCLIAPRPAGPPRTRRTSSGSAVPFSKTHCRIQGRKARHAPPPLDGTETPRSRFSNCREDEKRQKEYGGGALFLAQAALCKAGCRTLFPPRRAALYPAVRAPSFGVRVKMRGEHCKEKTRLSTWEGGSQPLRRGLT